MPASRTVTIKARFHGPPKSGNGGYVCGILAAEHGAPCDVRLRLPPPLDRPLAVERLSDSTTVLRDGDTIVAEARDVDSEFCAIDVPAPRSLEEARALSKHFTGFKAHVFPTCFVCGPEREPDDGLHIYPGRTRVDDPVVAVWTPHATLADTDGNVAEEFVWAALDCPGAFTRDYQDDGRSTLLGSLSCSLLHPVAAGTPYVVSGWAMGDEGRKAYAGTAVHGADGRLCAIGRATWIWIEL